MGAGTDISFPGPGDTNDHPASTAATGSDHSGAENQLYTWDTMRRLVMIHNKYDSGIYLFIKINADTASLASYDDILAPGARMKINDAGLPVIKVAIYADGATTYGTTFSVKGWR